MSIDTVPFFMPKKSTTILSDLETTNSSERVAEYEDLFEQSESDRANFDNTLDEKESMLLGKNLDKMTSGRKSKSQVNDHRLSTIVFERSARVMAQLPSGKVQALTQANRGKAELMQLVLDRYVMPNANNPQDHLTKLRMLDMYSMVYGSMPLLYDWQVTDSYVGPNAWLKPIRSVYYQPGKTTIAESDYAAVVSFVTVGWLKRQRTGENAWNRQAIQYVMKEAKGSGGADPRQDRTSFVERNRTPNGSKTAGDYALVELITFYEAHKDGHWVTFCPDFDWVMLRDIPNPHGNGKIPIILKHCFPLIDSMIGLGDFERGKTLQFAMNSLINLYLDGVKFSLFPPMKVVTDQVANKASLVWEPGQKFELKNINGIEPLQMSPQGMETFQSTYGFMIAALLNQNGTTDTARTQESDPGFGRTPQALEMQQQRESARDSWDRRMMEETTEELYNAYIDLICRKQEKPIKMFLFKDEIVRLRAAYPEDTYLEQYGRDKMDDFVMHDDKRSGVATVHKDVIGGKKGEESPYRFYLDAGTTQKKEQLAEHQQLGEILTLMLKVGPQALPNIDFNKLMEKFILSSGIEGADEIVLSEEELLEKQQQMAQQPIDPATGQPIPQEMAPDGMPAFPGINAPSGLQGTPPPAPPTAANPELQQFMNNLQLGGQ